MKIFAAFSLLLVTLTGCNSAPIMNQAHIPMNPTFRSFQADPDLVTIIDHNTTVLNKDKVIQKLMQNQITVNKADIFDKKNIFRIEFSNGHANQVPGFLRMYLRPTGVSEIQLVGNFFNNLPVELSAQETAALLKSAENYPAHRAQLDPLFQ